MNAVVLHVRCKGSGMKAADHIWRYAKCPVCGRRLKVLYRDKGLRFPFHRVGAP